MVCENLQVCHAKITMKQRKQWTAREKLIIITYYENSHSKRSTADKFEIKPKQLHE